ERPADERPVTGPLALVAVGNGDAHSGSSRWLARTDDLASVAGAGVAGLLPSCLRGGPAAGILVSRRRAPERTKEAACPHSTTPTSPDPTAHPRVRWRAPPRNPRAPA